jgi:CheY-like chemotaxis protein
LDSGVDLLSKPYSREVLARKLRQMLGDQPQQSGPRNAPMAESENGKADPVPPLRILLVEDEFLIRLATAEMLARAGHVVIEAGSAAEALTSLEREQVDVLLTDVGLPSASGVDLAREASRRWPGLRLIFASGYETLPASGDQEAPPTAVMLRKPYTQPQVVEALRAAMA